MSNETPTDRRPRPSTRYRRADPTTPSSAKIRERPRAGTPGADPRRLAGRTAHRVRPPRHLQRAHRGHQPADQEDQAGRARLPQPGELPATTPAALRGRLADCPSDTTPSPVTTLGCVEPLFKSRTSGHAASLSFRSGNGKPAQIKYALTARVKSPSATSSRIDSARTVRFAPVDVAQRSSISRTSSSRIRRRSANRNGSALAS